MMRCRVNNVPMDVIPPSQVSVTEDPETRSNNLNLTGELEKFKGINQRVEYQTGLKYFAQ